MRPPLLAFAALALFSLLLWSPSRTDPSHVVSTMPAASNAASPMEAPREHYRVTKVVDGDTVVVDMAGSTKTLRLIGLDTPETVDPRKPVQCFGKEASARAKALLENTYVRLEYDESQGTLDKYGRTLAYLYMEDGTLFNKYMIAEGFGHEYTYSIPYRYQADFQAAEIAAREANKGLWADGACADTSLPSGPSAGTAAGSYECARNAYNCADFSSRSEAQAAYDACAPSDIHKLDVDGDGEACESLP